MRLRSLSAHGALLPALTALTIVACSDLRERYELGPAGSLKMGLQIGDGVAVDTLSFAITGDGFTHDGNGEVGEDGSIGLRVEALPVGYGYQIALSATGPNGAICTGEATFDIELASTTLLDVPLVCGVELDRGDLEVALDFNLCPLLQVLSLVPSSVETGQTVALKATSSTDSAVAFDWEASSGELASEGASARWTCSQPGDARVTVTVRDGACVDSLTTTIPCTGEAVASPVVLNEIESSGGVPGDWVELYNQGSSSANVGGWSIKDNDDNSYVVPSDTRIPPRGYVVLDALGFGLDRSDSVRLHDTTGQMVDSYTWTRHAPVTYGRCPNGSGSFGPTLRLTKGGENSCPLTVRINEVESDGGQPGDWVELMNVATTAVDLSGWVLRDDDDSHGYTLPAGTVLEPDALLVLEQADFGFDFGESDSVRILDQGGSVIEVYDYAGHATTSHGRCPDGRGDFYTTEAVSKGEANECPLALREASPWPGEDAVVVVDPPNTYPSNLSGLHYEAGETPVLWGSLNGPSKVYRMIRNGQQWVPEPGLWATGKTLTYPSGDGEPDAEGVTRASWDDEGVYIATERDNSNSGTSRLSVLRFDSSDNDPTLIATHEWNLNALLPSVSANSGLEGITWIPDSHLLGAGFVDPLSGSPYDPADYADHGEGLFVVGVEGTGLLHLLALDHDDEAPQLLTTLSSAHAGVMGLEFDRDTGLLFAACDDGCGNQVTVFIIDAQGAFALAARFAPPLEMPNINNEGWAIQPEAECVNGHKRVFWSDDSNTLGNAVRMGGIPCGAAIVPE